MTCDPKYHPDSWAFIEDGEIETYWCETCGKPYSEFDIEDADMPVEYYDDKEHTCPDCWRENHKGERDC